MKPKTALETERACRTCHWYVCRAHEDDGELEFGTCQYNPPVAIGFPQVNPTDFCREWRDRDE